MNKDKETRRIHYAMAVMGGFFGGFAILMHHNLCSFTVKIDGKHGKLRSLLYASKAVEKESYADDGSCLLQIKLTAVDAAIIDSKTQGQLSQTCTSEDKPWIQSTEFDFNSVD